MFKHLMNQNVNIKEINGFDSYDKPIVTFSGTIKGKLEYRFKTIVNQNGEEVVSSGELRTAHKLKVDDLVEVDGEYKQIISVVPQDNFNGSVIYYVVYF